MWSPRALWRTFASHSVFLLFVVAGCLLGRYVNVYGCDHFLSKCVGRCTGLRCDRPPPAPA